MIRDYSKYKPFRFWCQKVLPLVYDDSLSYYELLNKVVDYLNNVIKDVTALGTAFEELNTMVTDYFENLDVQEEIDNKLDSMVEDGTLDAMILPLVGDAVSEWLEDNVTPTGSAVLVDSTLTISGASADAKVTGDEISDLKSDLSHHQFYEIGNAEINEEMTKTTHKYVGAEMPANKTVLISINLTNISFTRLRIHFSTAQSVSNWTDYLGEFNVTNGETLTLMAVPSVDALYVCATAYAKSGTQTFTVNVKNGRNIPKIDDTLTITGAAADAKVTGDITKKIETVIDEEVTRTYTELPSENPVRIPFPYNFVKGKTYKISIVADSVSLDHTKNNQIMLDSSQYDSTSVSGLVDILLRTGSKAVYSGDSWNITFVPETDNIKALLLRFKTLTGTQTFSVTVLEETTLSNVITDVATLKETVKQIPNVSNMQFGAHRGAEDFAPPNCVAAYEIAGQMGFQWAWIAQVRWSASHTLYVMHDEDVSITTNGTGNISELTDEYIQSLLCNKIQGYDYSKFTEADLRVPTLEEVIQICKKYGMKMCFRIEPFPADMTGAEHEAIWNNFVSLIKAYNIKDGIYSMYNTNAMLLTRSMLGDVNICPFRGNNTTAQAYIDLMNSIEINDNRSVLMYYTNTTLDDIKLLHTNNFDVYVFYNNITPTLNELNKWASYGVDILQNPTYAKLPID